MKRVEKPWGHELWFAHTRDYVGKIIVIEPGHRLSLQYHRQKRETVYALEGEWTLMIGPEGIDWSGVHDSAEVNAMMEEVEMRPGDSFTIAPGRPHRFCANDVSVRLIEVSTPEVDDVVRIEDDYRRESPVGLC